MSKTQSSEGVFSKNRDLRIDLLFHGARDRNNGSIRLGSEAAARKNKFRCSLDVESCSRIKSNGLESPMALNLSFANSKRAHSVLDPTNSSSTSCCTGGGDFLNQLDFSFTGAFSSFLDSKAVEFNITLSKTLAFNLSATCPATSRLVTVPSELVSSNSWSPINPRTTRILFSVKVPVLSEQIAVAPPIVSQLFKTRTRLPSFIIRVVAKARARVTANGNPSGTATTIMVIAVIKMLTNFVPF
ncbi:hypothetical protein OGAPHI_004441 [Ogataea philodendri]|uniref:Uncharacterized protein n=1 Tax=Ogataea philodendri TaxID=1378263 RepID=A0A9P8P7I2_9ASCO|nr:uncharacterized protein OGAPHI_004441 [Ogataea philodendri]KAH3666252.1 hypothetical protein OGAPHI_004441 [Ogataea philodendri]